MIRSVLFFIFSFCVVLNNAKADSLPEKMQGLWAIPDCRAPEQYIYHSENHVLYLTDKDAQLKTIDFEPTSQDYGILHTGKQSFPAYIHQDGILEIGILAKGMGLNTDSKWEHLPIDQRREYMRCAQDITTPHNIAKTALPLLDTLDAKCEGTSKKACKIALFEQADINNNKLLEQDEIDLINIQSLYLKTLLDARRPVSHDRITQVIARQSRSSSRFAQELLGDKESLTLEDLMNYPWPAVYAQRSDNIVLAQKYLIENYPALKK